MLPLPPEFITPDYQGRTIANVPATIAGWFDIPYAGLPPLRPELAGDFGPVQRIVRIIIDGLGWNLISALQALQPEFFNQATHTAKITSIFPSTTTAALSSLWTGLAAAQHGLVGLRIFFPEIGTLGQMINLSPTLTGEPEMLVAAGVDMENFLPGKGLGEQFAAGGVASYALKGWNIVKSPLSQMHGRGLAKQFGIVTAADMFVQLRELLAAKADERLFASGYWPAVDTLSHRYGPFSPHVLAEAAAVIQQLETLLLAPLRQDGRKDTLVCVLADHGQVETPMPEKLVIVDDHEVLRAGLMMIPAGDSRCAYLYTRHGQQAAVLDYLNSELAYALVAWPAEAVLANGLLGPQPHAPQAAHRTGDIVVAMRDGYAITHAGAGKVTRSMSGRHGSLTADEMEVPFLVFFV